MAKKKLTKKMGLEKKLRDYKKVLKDDYDWDWIFILRLLQYKLERTRKCILENNIIVEAPKVARQIREVEVLLKRVDQDCYFEEISKDFRKRYGRLRMKFKKAKPGEKYTTLDLKYAKETPRNAAKIHAEGSRLYRRAHKMQRNDLKKAFDLIFKNIWGWWD